MKWSRVLRSSLLCCLAPAFAVSCAAPSGAGADGPPRASASPAEKKCDVRTEPEPIRKRFLQLGEPRRTRWCAIVLGVENSRVPGPTDVRMVAVVEVTPDALKRILVYGTFAPAVPENVPPALVDAVPELRDARWTASEAFDASVTREAYTGTFYVDRAKRLVLVDAVNPGAADAPLVSN